MESFLRYCIVLGSNALAGFSSVVSQSFRYFLVAYSIAFEQFDHDGTNAYFTDLPLFECRYFGNQRCSNSRLGGQCFRGQCFRGQCFRGQCFRGQCFRGQCFRGQCFRGQCFRGQCFRGRCKRLCRYGFFRNSAVQCELCRRPVLIFGPSEEKLGRRRNW
jgi:uncharacterized protein YjbI with pentapeptide repeats